MFGDRHIGPYSTEKNVCFIQKEHALFSKEKKKKKNTALYSGRFSPFSPPLSTHCLIMMLGIKAKNSHILISNIELLSIHCTI